MQDVKTPSFKDIFGMNRLAEMERQMEGEMNRKAGKWMYRLIDDCMDGQTCFVLPKVHISPNWSLTVKITWA